MYGIITTLFTTGIIMVRDPRVLAARIRAAPMLGAGGICGRSWEWPMRLITWLGIGLILGLLVLDLALAASLSGRTMSELFEDAGEAVGLWKAATMDMR